MSARSNPPSVSSLRAQSVAFGTLNLAWLEPSEGLSLLDYALSREIRILNFTDPRYDGRSEALFGQYARGDSGCQGLTIVAEVSGIDMGVPIEPNLSAGYVVEAVDRTLHRMKISKLDTLLLPRPSFLIPVENTLEGIGRLLESGVILSYGTSTFPAWKLMEFVVTAKKLGLPPPIVDESPYNALDRRIENELLPFCLSYGVGIIAWAPLAQGLLAGRYRGSSVLPADSRAAMRGGVYRERVTTEAIGRSEAFVAIAQELGLTPAQLALSWVRSRDGVTVPVVGFRIPSHIDEALRSPKQLPPEILARIDAEVNPPGSAVVNFFNSAPWMKMVVDKK